MRYEVVSFISKRRQLVSYVVDSKRSWNLLVQFIGIPKEMYIDILRRLRDAVRRKRPQKWRSNSWFLLHDYATAHQLDLVKDFLANNNVTTPKHHLHSPDLTPRLIFTSSLDLNRHWKRGALLILISLRMRRNRRKSFHIMTSRSVSNAFRVTGRSISLHKGTILKEL